MGDNFLLSVSNLKFETLMLAIQVKMKEIFSQSYEEDLYSWRFH